MSFGIYNTSKKSTGFFRETEFYKSLFTIATPIMLQNFVNSLVNMLDTIMIGRLGTAEIAAVGLGNNFFFLFIMLLFGIGSGGAIFTAQFWGKRDEKSIRMNMGLCAVLSCVFAFVFMVFVIVIPEKVLSLYSKDAVVIELGARYLKTLSPSFIPFAISSIITFTLRSVEKVRLPMVTTMIALTINAILNYVFIFGFFFVPAMGVKGAAIATVISRFSEMFILIISSYRFRYVIIGPIKQYFSFVQGFFSRFIKIALPVILNEMIWSFGVGLQNIIFARTGTEAIAAFNITNTVSQLTWVFFMGLGSATGVIIGKKIGEQKNDVAKRYAILILKFASFTACFASLILIPLSFLLPYIFNVSQQVLHDARLMFIVLSACYPMRAFNVATIIGICRAGGDTVFSGLYDIVFMYAVSLPLAAAASYFFHAPAAIIYLCIFAEEPFKVIVGFMRIRSGKWLHNVVEAVKS
jgi:putative MATE family efflux protein